jgi:hypothetical protein
MFPFTFAATFGAPGAFGVLADLVLPRTPPATTAGTASSPKTTPATPAGTAAGWALVEGSDATVVPSVVVDDVDATDVVVLLVVEPVVVVVPVVVVPVVPPRQWSSLTPPSFGPCSSHSAP